jgi:hypothetical protein
MLYLRAKELEEQMNKTKGTAIVVTAIIALLVFQFIAGLSGSWGHGDWGMMEHRMMMGGMNFTPLSWLGVTFMWLILIGLVVLAVLGVVWSARKEDDDSMNSAMTSCPSCGYEVQTDWDDCPCCGTALSNDLLT